MYIYNFCLIKINNQIKKLSNNLYEILIYVNIINILQHKIKNYATLIVVNIKLNFKISKIINQTKI